MACCPAKDKYGYVDSRFERDVDEHFHCSICYNVLKEPRSCRNNDHVFCLDCITEHLNVNSQTCPECNENLSVDTLRRPRVLNNYLSKLKINCDYASRGCPEFVCVEDLKTHVANCGFAPISCSNQNCDVKINKRDKVHHETVECEYRTMKCHECGLIREDVGALRGSLVELVRKVETVSGKVQNSHVGTTTVVGKLKGSFGELDRKIEAAIMNLNGKVEASSAETKNSFEQIRRDHKEVKKEVQDVKENLYKVNKDVDEVKVLISQMLDNFSILEQSIKLPSPSEGKMNRKKEDILIAGGNGPCSKTGQSAEIFSWEKNSWFEASPMGEEHKGASSFICNDQIFIVGGESSNTIETLDLNELPLKWTRFPVKLPYHCSDHQIVVYQQRFFYIGGFNYDIKSNLNVISELELTSSCTMKELCRMPEPREFHRAEIVEDKIVILGGESDRANALPGVLEIDPRKKKCREIHPLPRPLASMATALWRDQVVVIGGRDNDDKVLNYVYMYDCKTGKIVLLPSMLEKRYQCCAVITGNTVVVMGGLNEDNKALKSVESFTMGDSTWKYLPAMNKARESAVAEVLPPQRKFV